MISEEIIFKMFEYFAENFNDKVSKEKDLKDYLNDLSINEIKNRSMLARYIFAEKPQKLKKEEVINLYIEEINNSYKNLLNFLNKNCIEGINYILNNNSYLEIELKRENFELSINTLNIIQEYAIGFINYNKEKRILKIHIPLVISNYLKKNINKKEIVKERNLTNKVFDRVHGYLEAYGALSIDNLYELYQEQYNDVEYDDFIVIIYMKSMLETVNIIEFNNEQYIGIITIEELKSIITEGYKEKEFYNFSDTELIKLKNKNYLKDFKSYQKLKKYLLDNWYFEKLDFEDFKTAIIDDYLYSSQTDEKRALNNLRHNLDKHLDDPDEVIEEVIALIINLKYDYPSWKLKGHKMSKKIITSTKIGRNEPCPCGSGKKYKHCCNIK